MQSSTFLQIFKTAAQRWLERDAFVHAGALGFCTLFSLAPLVIIVVSIVGIVFGQDAASGQISAAITDLVGAQAATAVEEAVRRSRLEEAGLLPTILGIGALIFGATTVFAQMQGALNQFWGVKAKPARSGVLTFITVRLLSLGMVLIIGFLMLTSFIVSLGITGIIEYAREWMPVPGFAVVLIDLTISLGVTTVLFGMLFKVLPDVKVRWADVWRGAFITALLTMHPEPLEIHDGLDDGIHPRDEFGNPPRRVDRVDTVRVQGSGRNRAVADAANHLREVLIECVPAREQRGFPFVELGVRKGDVVLDDADQHIVPGVRDVAKAGGHRSGIARRIEHA